MGKGNEVRGIETPVYFLRHRKPSKVVSEIASNRSYFTLSVSQPSWKKEALPSREIKKRNGKRKKESVCESGIGLARARKQRKCKVSLSFGAMAFGERVPNVVSRLTDYLGTPLHFIHLHFSSTRGSDSACLLIKHMDVIKVRTPISNKGAGILEE